MVCLRTRRAVVPKHIVDCVVNALFERKNEFVGSRVVCGVFEAEPARSVVLSAVYLDGQGEVLGPIGYLIIEYCAQVVRGTVEVIPRVVAYG